MYKKDLFKVISTIRVDVRCFSIDLNICPKLKSRLYQNQPNSKNKYFTYILRIAHTCWKLKIHKKKHCPQITNSEKIRPQPFLQYSYLNPNNKFIGKFLYSLQFWAVLAAPSEINNIAIISPA